MTHPPTHPQTRPPAAPRRGHARRAGGWPGRGGRRWRGRPPPPHGTAGGCPAANHSTESDVGRGPGEQQADTWRATGTCTGSSPQPSQGSASMGAAQQTELPVRRTAIPSHSKAGHRGRGGAGRGCLELALPAMTSARVAGRQVSARPAPQAGPSAAWRPWATSVRVASSSPPGGAPAPPPPPPPRWPLPPPDSMYAWAEYRKASIDLASRADSDGADSDGSSGGGGLVVGGGREGGGGDGAAPPAWLPAAAGMLSFAPRRAASGDNY